MKTRSRWVYAVAICVALTAWRESHGQTPRTFGENVQPVFEGWEKNPDGTYNMVFGYLNRNYEEEPHIPVGPSNSIEPGGPDRGQPTHFYPRRQQFVFKVTVPADWPIEKDVVWTLTHNGRADRAYGSLWREWELSDHVYRSNRSSGGQRDPKAPPNVAPTIKVEGDTKRTVSLPATLSLTALVTDDGNPKPQPPRTPPPPRTTAGGTTPPVAGSPRLGPRTQAIVKPNPKGLAVTWIHFRGPGKVKFDPMSGLVTDGKMTTTVSFGEPGTYVLRAYADDMVLLTPADITVTVIPPVSTRR